MTQFPFLINGVDFSDVVHRRGYATNREPVYAAAWTDLSGYSHRPVLRTRGTLAIQLNDLKNERSQELCQALLEQPLRVTYWSFNLGRQVTESMEITSVPRQLLLVAAGQPWIAGATLNFTQL